MNRVKSASNHTFYISFYHSFHILFLPVNSTSVNSVFHSVNSILFEILNPQAFIPNSISTFHATFLYAIFGTLCVLPFILHSIPYFMLHVVPYIPHSCYSTFHSTCTCTFLSPFCATKPFQIPCYFLFQIPCCTCCTFHSLFRSTFHILDTVV